MAGDDGLNELLLTARQAADAAAAIHRRDSDSIDLDSATEKGRADYVSRTDLDAQKAALGLILSRHPDHAILAEESEGSVAAQLADWDGRPLWIVDPLDGTANFLHGHPSYCASVAVAVEGRLVAGAIASAPTDERWWAAEGLGAWRSGRRMSVSQPKRLIQSLVATGFPFKDLPHLPDYLGSLERVLTAASGVRRAGAAALDLAFLAQGSFDAFWENLLMPWDFAAGAVLIQEAGGVIRRPDGSPLDLTPGPVCAANSPALLDELLAAVHG